MAVRLGTGVVLLPAWNADGQKLPIAAEVFVDYGAGREERVGGNFMTATVRLDADPTTDLVNAAHSQRELNLGTLLGDLRIAGEDVTRFEIRDAVPDRALRRPTRTAARHLEGPRPSLNGSVTTPTRAEMARGDSSARVSLN